jgi:hypothetical protein
VHSNISIVPVQLLPWMMCIKPVLRVKCLRIFTTITFVIINATHMSHIMATAQIIMSVHGLSKLPVWCTSCVHHVLENCWNIIMLWWLSNTFTTKYINYKNRLQPGIQQSDKAFIMIRINTKSEHADHWMCTGSLKCCQFLASKDVWMLQKRKWSILKCQEHNLIA